MRKVTASAVILTALTGCGQSSGIPSTQWSFEIPPEDQIASAQFDTDSIGAESDADSTLFASQPWNTDAADSGMMGPAFFQPEAGALGGNGISGLSAAGRPGGKEPSGLDSAGYSSLLSASSTSYQSVSPRPDPVAQVKAFLSANRSPSSLTNRAPYQSQVLLPSMPAVATPLPTSAIMSTLGDPTGMEARVVPSANRVTFASASLPTVGFSSGGAYSLAGGEGTYTAANFSPSPYQPAAYPTVNESVMSDRSTVTGTVAADRTLELSRPAAVTEDGLPVLAPIQDAELESRLPASQTRAQPLTEDLSIGTAILRDLQYAEPAQVAQSQTAEQPATDDGFISIDVVPATTADYDSSAVAQQPTQRPTLARLLRSMPARETPPIVAATPVASLPYQADDGRVALSAESAESPVPVASLPNLQADESELSAIGLVNSAPQEVAASDISDRTDFPTIESLLETMPEDAAAPNFEANSLDGQSASPLLEGLKETTPLSTLYMPIPPEPVAEVALANAAESGLQVAGQSVNETLASDPSDTASAVALVGERVLRNALASMLTPDGNLRILASRLMSHSDAGLEEADAIRLRGDRNDAILSLVGKRVAKRRQLVTWQ